jgi:hypothetical protein
MLPALPSSTGLRRPAEPVTAAFPLSSPALAAVPVTGGAWAVPVRAWRLRRGPAAVPCCQQAACHGPGLALAHHGPHQPGRLRC